MDWLSKVEEERRAKAATEKEAMVRQRRGVDEDVVRGYVDLETFVRGDLQLLMQWLVRTALDERESAPVPKIRTFRER